MLERLDKSVVHQICTNQVVVTLQACVKELVENSLDAGATRIEVRLRESGSELLEVVDDGCGISSKDYSNLAMRHSTSKIRAYDDLSTSLATFGFRGEALSGICAMGEVSVCTRCASDAHAALLVYDRYGNLVGESLAAREVGTTISVRELFAHLPVRHREFMRNAKAQVTATLKLIQAYALAQPEVRFHVIAEKTRGVGAGRATLLSTSGSARGWRHAVAAVLGDSSVADVIPIEMPLGKSGWAVTGLISTPLGGRRSRDIQLFFCNRRPIDPPKPVIRLINDIFHQHNARAWPVVILSLAASQGLVDINVTPDKRRVFLHNEDALLFEIKQKMHELYGPFASTRLAAAKDSLVELDSQASQISLASQDSQASQPYTEAGSTQGRAYANSLSDNSPMGLLSSKRSACAFSNGDVGGAAAAGSAVTRDAQASQASLASQGPGATQICASAHTTLKSEISPMGLPSSRRSTRGSIDTFADGALAEGSRVTAQSLQTSLPAEDSVASHALGGAGSTQMCEVGAHAILKSDNLSIGLPSTKKSTHCVDSQASASSSFEVNGGAALTQLSNASAKAAIPSDTSNIGLPSLRKSTHAFTIAGAREAAAEGVRVTQDTHTSCVPLASQDFQDALANGGACSTQTLYASIHATLVSASSPVALASSRRSTCSLSDTGGFDLLQHCSGRRIMEPIDLDSESEACRDFDTSGSLSLGPAAAAAAKGSDYDLVGASSALALETLDREKLHSAYVDGMLKPPCGGQVHSAQMKTVAASASVAAHGDALQGTSTSSLVCVQDLEPMAQEDASIPQAGFRLMESVISSSDASRKRKVGDCSFLDQPRLCISLSVASLQTAIARKKSRHSPIVDCLDAAPMKSSFTFPSKFSPGEMLRGGSTSRSSKHLMIRDSLVQSTLLTRESDGDQDDYVIDRNITFDRRYFSRLRIIGQFNLEFIVAVFRTGLWSRLVIVNQHAAESRMQLSSLASNVDRQLLVPPETLHLSDLQEQFVKSHLEAIRRSGFDLSEDEAQKPGQRLHLTMVPGCYGTSLGAEKFLDFLRVLEASTTTDVRASGGKGGGEDSVAERALVVTQNIPQPKACKLVVGSSTVGVPLRAGDMKSILNSALSSEHPWRCPHRRPMVLHFADIKDDCGFRSSPLADLFARCD